MAPRHSTASPRDGGRLGPATVAVGGLLVLLAHVTLSWYPRSGGPDVAPGGNFASLGREASRLSDATVAAPYFTWLSWTTLVLAVVLGLAAARSGRATDVLRVAGFATGVFGLVVTYYALAQLFHVSTGVDGGFGTVLAPADAGVWSALIGYALCALGAATGAGSGRSDTISR